VSGLSYAGSWRIWWELNREYIFGLRKTHLRGKTITEGGLQIDPKSAYRNKVLEALRKLAADTSAHDELRSVVLRALGRAGTDADAKLFLKMLRTPNLEPRLLEGAALGLGSLPAVSDGKTKWAMLDLLRDLFSRQLKLPDRATHLAILSLSLRGREDEEIVNLLMERCKRSFSSTEEAAAILFGCGLTRDVRLKEVLLSAATTGRFGGRKLQDPARSHCVLALAMCAGRDASLDLAKLLLAKKVQLHTRRSIALALGLLLREGSLDGVSDKALQKTLLLCLDEENDPLVQGYCCIAMGAAKRPFLTNVLFKLLDKKGSAAVRPYAAVALGLAARTVGGEEAYKIRTALLKRLSTARGQETQAALSIALGLAEAPEAREVLAARLAKRSLNGYLRGAACQGIGMIGDPSESTLELLKKALEDGEHEVVEDSALALGFLGEPGTGKLLADTLERTRSPQVQLHMVVALSHLGGTEAVPKLLSLLESRNTRRRTRESAANALGILFDPRERDPLFMIDAYANPYGLTHATRELVRVY
jgi:HEAT repeat protein